MHPRERLLLVIVVVASIVFLVIDTSWATVFALSVALHGIAVGVWVARRSRARA